MKTARQLGRSIFTPQTWSLPAASVPREEREVPYAGPTEVRQASTGKVTATLPSLPGGWQPNAVSVVADDRGGRPGLLDVEGGESLGGFGLDGDGVDDG